ncbi:MAG: hypothetical protein CMF57_06155 [Leifsonia sp.]|nr:hypothetical protein [Leifsonia sp.]
MSPEPPDTSRDRPVLFGQVSAPRSIPGPTARGGQRVTHGNAGARVARVDNRLDEALEEMQTQVDLSTSINAADPQLVLVMEAVEDRIDLVAAAQRLGLEVLVEADSAMDPDDEYSLRSDRPRDPVVHTSLHAVCADQTAFNRLRSAWNTWKQTQQVPGNAPLRDFFTHLRDIRPWGPQDRLKLIGSDEYLHGLLPDQRHPIEIELWFRTSAVWRQRAQDEVSRLVTAEGGEVISSAVIPEVGYHGMSCMVSTELLRRLATGDIEHVQLIKSSNIMYLRVTGQLAGSSTVDAQIEASPTGPLPSGSPVVAILDGVPVGNHPLLQGRIEILDPDELESRYGADERRHGTHMASAVVWGDLSSPSQPLNRPVLVRPIMAPAADTVSRIEELPRDQLTPDLMWRAFRDLFEEVDGQRVAAPDIVIVNLSVGDPATPFDTLLSAWARIIDWLSYHYGVLIVVSAGNHLHLPLPSGDSQSITALTGDARRQAILHAQEADPLGRRLLAPSEAINALTVGAIHADGTGTAAPGGYVIDPTDGLISVSPVSALGTGYRRSIKPEIAAPGGRIIYPTPMTAQGHIDFRESGAHGPGVRVAHAVTPRETFVAGTSVAAALATRQAARLHDELDRITGGASLTRAQRAVAIKALLAHGATPLDDPALDHPVTFLGTGNGALSRDYSDGCAPNEAVVLYIGALRPNTSQDLLLPLPDGLSAREVKRIGATLAWLSPVNWRHRQYRQARLEFTKPGGDIPQLDTPIGVPADAAKRGATTLQHLAWETNKSFGAGQGSALSLTVKCYGQGGLQDERIEVDYAVALSLWVAPTVGVDVYTQVRDQVRVRVRPRPDA